MARDVKAIIEATRGTIPGAYDLTCGQWRQLTEQTFLGISSSAEAIQKAFVYGFAMGRRCEKNRKKAPTKR